jgi:hypothetical protein
VRRETGNKYSLEPIRLSAQCHSYEGCDLLEQLQPFPAQAVFKREEAGDIAAGAREALNKASADRIGGLGKHNWNGARQTP